jgi:hypothetical protein
MMFSPSSGRAAFFAARAENEKKHDATEGSTAPLSGSSTAPQSAPSSQPAAQAAAQDANPK